MKILMNRNFTRKKKLMSLRESGILSALFLHNNTPNLQKAKIFNPKELEI
jgi:hypothetical protein